MVCVFKTTMIVKRSSEVLTLLKADFPGMEGILSHLHAYECVLLTGMLLDLKVTDQVRDSLHISCSRVNGEWFDLHGM